MADEILAQQILQTLPLVMRTVAAEMRQADPLVGTAHFHLLWLLEEKSFSLSELAERHAVSLPTMSNSITILEERGWAHRVRSEEDRRKVVIEITAQGREVLAQTRSQMQERVAEIIKTLSDDEQEAVSQGLRILRDTFISASAHIHDCQPGERGH